MAYFGKRDPEILPSRPKVWRSTAVAAVFGGFGLGMITFFAGGSLPEFFDPNIENPDDLIDGLQKLKIDGVEVHPKGDGPMFGTKLSGTDYDLHFDAKEPLDNLSDAQRKELTPAQIEAYAKLQGEAAAIDVKGRAAAVASAEGAGRATAGALTYRKMHRKQRQWVSAVEEQHGEHVSSLFHR